MNSPNHRCCQCRRLFDPDPRVGDRQVTCGRAECQRAQHKETCRRWRRRHRELAASHYQDVVEPFRKRHPGYQRRRRIVVGLREIREQISELVVAVHGRLGGLLARGLDAQQEALGEPAQVRATTGRPLGAALAAAASLLGVVDKLGAGVAELVMLGGECRETRYESR